MNNIIKKVHMYAGLLAFSVLLVYGIAGLEATFQAAPDRRVKPEPAVRYEPFTPPPGLTDKEMADRVHAHLKLPLTSPIPGWAVRRNKENNLALDFYTANGIYRTVLLEKENRVRIETTRPSVWQFLNNLHATTVSARVDDLRMSLWKYYNEFAMWCMIGMSLSGVYLWLSSRPGHRVAQICLAAGSGVFVVLYVVTR